MFKQVNSKSAAIFNAQLIAHTQAQVQSLKLSTHFSFSVAVFARLVLDGRFYLRRGWLLQNLFNKCVMVMYRLLFVIAGLLSAYIGKKESRVALT